MLPSGATCAPAVSLPSPHRGEVGTTGARGLDRALPVAWCTTWSEYVTATGILRDEGYTVTGTSIRRRDEMVVALYLGSLALEVGGLVLAWRDVRGARARAKARVLTDPIPPTLMIPIGQGKANPDRMAQDLELIRSEYVKLQQFLRDLIGGDLRPRSFGVVLFVSGAILGFIANAIAL